MGYADLAHRLRTDESEASVTAFPDGSIDVYYALLDPQGRRIDSHVEFADRINAAAEGALQVERVERRPGGRAVNAARQADALGDRVTLFGHVDDPLFDDLGFETVSMGEPTTVLVFEFAGTDLMLADRSPDIETWSLADARDAGPFDAHLNDDAVCCLNWSSVDGMTDALATLASERTSGNTFVFDPGDFATRPHEAVERLFDVLGALDRSYDVVVSVNRNELDYAAEAFSADGGDGDVLEAVRSEAAITATVLHGKSVAVAATADGETRVDNIEVEGRGRRTGAGDRFSAGLAHALARDWSWETALRLGNACASYRVETGGTGTREALATFLDSHDAC